MRSILMRIDAFADTLFRAAVGTEVVKGRRPELNTIHELRDHGRIRST